MALVKFWLASKCLSLDGISNGIAQATNIPSSERQLMDELSNVFNQ